MLYSQSDSSDKPKLHAATSYDWEKHHSHSLTDSN